MRLAQLVPGPTHLFHLITDKNGNKLSFRLYFDENKDAAVAEFGPTRQSYELDPGTGRGFESHPLRLSF